MLTHKDQLDFFKIVANGLKTSISCFAFGGNAMMFYGYKNETKDVDLVFAYDKDREAFVYAIEKIGFEETSPIEIYELKKLRDKSKPVMYKREDYRLDLFVGKIFRTKVNDKMKEDLFAVHEFKGKKTLKINVFRKEHIVLLKSITDRDKDTEDILTILNKEKNFDWQYFIDEVIWQHNHGDSWVLLDVEKMLKELKKYILIEEKYFKQLYKAQS